MKKISILGLVLFTMSLSFGISSSQSGQDLFQKALAKERAEGNLGDAIVLYQKVIDESQDMTLKAKAQLQIGMCYEKLGQREAIKAYELVLENYSGHTEQVAAARARLAELKKEEPNGLTVTKTRFGMNEPFDLSPDGTKMVGVNISPNEGQNVVVSYLEKRERDYITNFEWMDENGEYTDEYYWTYHPVWSPDGGEIAYSVGFSRKKGNEDNSLRVSNLDKQARILIQSETDWYAPQAWMPNGASILTIQGNMDNNQKLGLVPSQGGEFRLLVSLHGPVARYGSSRATASVSPDGRFIVYTDVNPGKESELFITTSDGKIPWPLASSPAADRSPRWSPDGNHIIFLSNRHGNWALWGVAVDGGKPGIPFLIRDGMGNNLFGNWTVHGLVSWNWIVMRDVFLLDVNPRTGEPAGKPRQLDYMPSGSNSMPVFSLEGNRIAFVRRDTSTGRFYLVVTEADKGKAQEFEMPEGFTPRFSFWVPDGSGIGIYCGSVNGNILVSLNFNSQKWKTAPLPTSGVGWTTVDMAWSGKDIFYGKNGVLEEGAGIFERNLETGVERLVFRPEEGNRINIRALKFSRDKKKLAYLESNSKLTVVDLQTRDSRVLSSKSELFPAWSPDGQRIMCLGSVDPEKKGKFLSVFSVVHDSVEEYDLSSNIPRSSVYRPDWSADGTQVAFTLRQNKGEHLIYKNIIPKEKK